MNTQDQTIICSDCGDDFIFTAGERQFYIDRGFEYPPKRCKSCRAQRKQQQASRNREASVASSNTRNTNHTSHQRSRDGDTHYRPREAPPRPHQNRETTSRSQGREVHLTTCQACGVSTKVPFRPQEGRGVYCPECYHALKALSRASREENFS